MKKTFKLFLAGISSVLLILLTVYFTSCSMNNEDSSKKEEPTASTNVVFTSKADPDGGDITVDAELYSSIFGDSTKYDETLAISSLCMTVEAEDKETLKDFFDAFGFKTFEAYNGESGDYDDKDNPDSISYGLAHMIDPYDNNGIIEVAIRGVNYSSEWTSNFNIGKDGEHHGFSNAAKLVYTGLKSYIDKNFSEEYTKKKLKLWITGYSRSAAVADILSYYILTGLDTTYAKLDIDKSKVFTYTFATPRSLIAEHAEAYTNVFNHISNADLVTYVAPKEYELYRCGTDKVLFESDKSQYTEHKDAQSSSSDYTKYKLSYTSVVDEWLKTFSSEINLPDFCTHNYYVYKGGKEEHDFPGSKYATEKECIKFFMDLLLNATGEGASFTTREKFVDTAQPTVQYFVNLYMNNSDKFSTFISEIKNNVFTLMGKLSSETDFCNYITGLLTNSGITVKSESVLKEHLAVLYKSANPLSTTASLSTIVMQYVVPMMIGGNTDFQRIIKMHYPEVTLITLLKSFPES